MADAIILDMEVGPDELRQTNDDWILDAETRAEELALVRGLEISKGGPGSGFRGHAGRPGFRGGSQHRDEGGYGPDDQYYQAKRDQLDAGNGVAGGPVFGGAGDEPMKQAAISAMADGLPDQNPYGASDPNQGRWDALTSTQNKEFAKNELVERLADETGIEYETVNRYIKGWTHSSTESPTSQIMQEAAAEAFGSEMSDWQEGDHEKLHDIQYLDANPDIAESMRANIAYRHLKVIMEANARWESGQTVNPPPEHFAMDMRSAHALLKKMGLTIPETPEQSVTMAEWVKQDIIRRTKGTEFGDLYQNDQPRAEDFGRQLREMKEQGISLDPKSDMNQGLVKAIYAETQSYLKAKGVKYITLFRGMRGYHDSEVTRALEASKGYHVDLHITNSNVLSSWSFNQTIAQRFADTERGFVLYMTVPASRVWSMARTGPGCLNEQEFILLPGKNDMATAFSLGQPHYEGGQGLG